MKPFLRPTDRGRLAPVGWVAEPAGRWAGAEVEVVYDPRRHNVLLLRSNVSDVVRTAAADTGYRRVGMDGTQEMWVRDRLAATRAVLERLDRSPERQRAAETRGLEL